MMKKDVVAGLGEIGTPILKLLSKNSKLIGFDVNTKLMNKQKFKKLIPLNKIYKISTIE